MEEDFIRTAIIEKIAKETDVVKQRVPILARVGWNSIKGYTVQMAFRNSYFEFGDTQYMEIDLSAKDFENVLSMAEEHGKWRFAERVYKEKFEGFILGNKK